MSEAQRGRTARLADVAEAAGVSKGTASNVFNKPDIVREEVRERVLEAARAIGYHGPDPKGRLLSAGKVNAIGVATAEKLSYFFTDSFSRELMAAIADSCARDGTGISLISAADDAELSWNMRSAVVDGFILFCLEGTDTLVELSRERSLPVVALAYGRTDEDVSVIGVDNVAAAHKAAEHLIDLGHRRFAILAMEFNSGSFGPADRARAETAFHRTTADRVTGYLEALEAAGIDPESVPIFETLMTEATVHAGLEAIFAAETPPTALLCQSDEIAFYALDWLKARDLRVPDDVSVIGFDGVEESALSTPPLTTMRQPIRRIGELAVQAISEKRRELRHVTLDVELVVRASTGPARRS